jgi:amino acid adenylation domain-containing protein/FkbM family methyltransferase
MKQSIPRRTNNNSVPLSFAQQRLWFLNQLEPNNAVYNVYRAWRLSGRLNIEALQRAVDTILARHEVLRATFRLVEEQPIQVTAAALNISLEIIDLQSFSSEEREAQSEQLAVQEARLPFDLERGPLFRVKLFRLAGEEHILLLTLHHIITDGWSLGILYREIAELYEAFNAGKPSPLAQLPIQYSDYSLWQREQLQGDILEEEQLTYWKRQLADLPVSGLPTDRARPSVQSQRGARALFWFSPTLTAQLKGLSQREGVTLFMTLLAAFKVLLFRYTGQADVVVGSPIAGRTRVETEELIGFFVNTLVLRTDLSGNPTFRELVGRVRHVALAAYSHQDLPFERLVEELRPERDLSRSLLFQVMFQLRNLPGRDVEIPGLRVERINLDIGVARFDLNLEIEDTPKGLACTFEYSTDLFSPAMIDRMQGHFQTLLEGIAADPQQRISDLPLLTWSERHRLLVEWNDTDRDYQSDKCIHELFEEQVEKTPDLVAVVFENQQLTYRELNTRANQLAHYLRKRGVGPEVLVVICMERSLEMVVGLLGILKAGGAYVPLDAEYPASRLAFVLEDTAAPVLLTKPKLPKRLPAYAGRTVALDTDWAEIARERKDNPKVPLGARNLAYVIYTSGSTGQPKGVCITHASLRNLIRWHQQAYEVSPADRATQIAGPAFDASAWELWPYLTAGASVYMPNEATRLNAARLVRWLIEQQITVSFLSTPLTEAALRERWPEQGALRLLLTGGDRLNQHPTHEFPFCLVNHYGPTENTVVSTCTEVQATDALHTAPPIGRPLPNTRAYVVDPYLQPVPIGVAGELLLGGVQLATGYLNRPELTAERFIADPFSAEPGAQLYRTGDLVRYLPDGNIEFLWRIDHQVKIRGFRIELGEIEAILSQHPAVRETVVLARDDALEEDAGIKNQQSKISKSKNLKSDKRLVAYVVPRQEQAPRINELRSFLKQKLPEYMVPSVFVFLDALPLMPNGKLDRKTLPPPVYNRAQLSEVYVAPRTHSEKILTRIWQEVLKIEEVGVYDNFFDLGGQSLMAVQVVSRIRDALQVDLSLRSIFEKPTIAALAKGLEASPQREDRAEAHTSAPVGETLARPLSFAQQRLWFLDQLEPETALYNISEAFRINGPLDVAALERSVNEIVRRHEVLRTTFSARDGLPVQIIWPSLHLRIPVVDVSDRHEKDHEAEAKRLAREAAERPFDLARGPLLRTTLLRLGNEDHVLLLSMHHIVSDGWSVTVFLREITALYDAFSNGRPTPLSNLTSQYSDYVQWQHHELQGEALEKQVTYWKRQLAGVSTLPLRTDRPRPPVQSFRGDQQLIVLPHELTNAVKTLSQKQHLTLFMTLLTAFKALLRRYSGQQDIAIGVPIAGRNRLEYERLIGFFVNTLVLRTKLSGASTFRELLDRVREVALAAYTYQELPFEKLIEELQPERDLSHNPLFQVMFQLRNLPKETLNLANSRVEPFPFDKKLAKFDLALDITEIARELQCVFTYNTDLFDASTIMRMQQHYKNLLERSVAQPDRPIDELPLLTEAERLELLVKRTGRKEAHPEDHCIHHLFEEQVERTPETAAVIFAGQQMTYCELNRRANQLAHYLKRRGIGPEVRVALCLAPSLEMIVGLLGVLKAGGAYVPVDPDYPDELVQFMLEDVQAPTFLTRNRFADRFRKYKTEVINLDRDWQIIARENDRNPTGSYLTSALAYVIYTSGSTGKPKGVTVEHRQIINYTTAIMSQLGLAPGNSFAMVQPLTVDASLTVVFLSLLTGGSLHVIPRERALSPSELSDYFARWPIDVLKIAPSHLAALQAAGRAAEFMPRRWLVIGGEESRWDWIQSLRALNPNCTILNHYGPTETTVGVLTYLVGESKPHESYSKAPLGRPISNTRVFVLDASLQPVPIGVPGELYIAGESLTRGYLNHPDLTAEKFIPNPFGDLPGERLYRTGDSCCYLADGNIGFLGRTDAQVKIRGFRIEPGEIEAALAQHPDVRQVAVMAEDDALGQKRLVAYVTPKQERSPTINSKQRYKLPNRLAVAQLNKNETDYMYEEIFQRQAYLKHGISFSESNCIFDVGANIGLFMLFANQLCQNLKIYAFEPNPTVFEILRANAALYGAGARLFNYGLADAPKSATFTFFPGFSLSSGFYADPVVEKEVVKSFVTNQEKAGISGMAGLLQQADDFLNERFVAQSFICQLRTLSDMIEQEGIQCIDLLKINVEKSELDILRGIKERDWQKIKQIVLEVDVQGNLPIITSLLEKHGYEFAVEQDALLENTLLCYVYAIRPSKLKRLVAQPEDGRHIRPLPILKDPLLSTNELRNFLSRKLAAAMVPSRFVILETMPLTPHGKLNRKALAVPENSRPGLDHADGAPGSPVEERLAQLYAELLTLEKVGIFDSFFDLGGHSLLAIQLLSRIRSVFGVELPVRKLFEAPRIADLAALIETFPPAVRAHEPASLAQVSLDDNLPLSFSQERFWVLDQLQPNGSAYNVCHTFRLIGPLDISALAYSLGEIVRRHEVLRTNFEIVNDRPVQVVREHRSFEVEMRDLVERGHAVDGSDVQKLLEDEAKRPFNLSNDILLRVTVLKLAPNEYVLIVVLHHIASDHWSLAILWQELAALYKSSANEYRPRLPELPFQYRHFAVWQRSWSRGEVLQRQLSYWKQQLGGSPSSSQLPLDYPRPPLKTFSAERISTVLSNHLTSALKRLSQTEEVTLFMTLLGALKVLLHRHIGQTDILVGTPVAGRNRTESEKLIGCFLNSIVLRTHLSGNPTFRELLARVREVVLGAFDHQELPFERLLKELGIERDLSRTPLFQVFFNMYNFDETALELYGLEVERLGITRPVSNFDLTLYVRERDNALHLSLVYNTDLFDPRRMLDILEQYKHLLTQVVAHPDERIASFSLLTRAAQKLLPDPRESLGSDWAGAIQERLSHQAKHRPEQIVLLDRHDRWTYEELNSRSNQLAHYFLTNGIQSEDIVAVYGERSASLVWAVFGILKAGAAFLILDPAYPIGRLIEYVRAARPQGFVTLKAPGKLPDELESFIQQTVRCHVTLPSPSANQNGGLLSNYPTADPTFMIRPDHLAYVSYTSGTTGEPRGILGRHGPLTHFLPWQTEKFSVHASDRFSLLSGLSHDPLQREIFTAVWVGATICIPDSDIIGTPGQLAEWMAQQQITFAHLTPSLGRLLTTSAKPPSQLPSLRYAFFVGDKLTWTDVTRLRLTAPQVTCVNYYGSTETQRAVSYYEILPGAENRSGGPVVPVGRGMPDVQLLVLMNEKKLAGLGEIGEIYVRSPHLALGYLGDASLNQARFMTNPFTGEAQDRLYRSGDLGRYLHDGSVEILGRSDRQIKIRGFRVEPGEIESALKQHPRVRDAAVVGREDGKGNDRLVAYLVADRHRAPERELRGFLRGKLPNYMIPSAFVSLEALPLTPNGKLDHRALPAPDRNRAELEESFVAPRTPIEEELTRIWAEILGLERVSVNGNFFDLGGHSLLATQMIARVRGVFQVDIPLRALFEKPTVEELAVAIAGWKAMALSREELSNALAELESLSQEEISRLLVAQEN